MEKGKGTIVQVSSPVDSPHYGFLRSCAGCFWGAVLHLGCEVNGDAREAPIPTLTNKQRALSTATKSAPLT